MSYKLNKVASLAGIASIAAMMLPGVASAHQELTVRSATLGSSVVDAYNTVGFQFDSASAATVKGIRIQVCTSPIYSAACTAPTNASLAGATLASQGGQLSGFAVASNSATDITLTNSTGVAVTVGGISSLSLSNFRNPTTYGTFYFRVTTYTDTALTSEVDFGAVAVSTAKSITVTGDVAETLTFEVGNTVDCTGANTDITDPNDTTEDLVTLTPSTMSMGAASTGTAQFCVITNAQHGYVVTYKDEGGYLANGTKGFWNGSHEFSTADGVGNGSAGGTATSVASTPGTEQFAFNVVANTVPVVGANPVGDTTGVTLGTGYNVANAFSYNDSGTAVTLASKTTPSNQVIYTLGYMANIAALTPAGTYQAHQIFIATASF